MLHGGCVGVIVVAAFTHPLRIITVRPFCILHSAFCITPI